MFKNAKKKIKYTASEFQIKSLFFISWSGLHFPVNETTVMGSTVWITKYYKIQIVLIFKKQEINRI